MQSIEKSVSATGVGSTALLGSLEICLEGATLDEQFNALVSIVCSACTAKQDGNTKDWPLYISETGAGSIRFVPNDRNLPADEKRHH